MVEKTITHISDIDVLDKEGQKIGTEESLDRFNSCAFCASGRGIHRVQYVNAKGRLEQYYVCDEHKERNQIDGIQLSAVSSKQKINVTPLSLEEGAAIMKEAVTAKG